MNKFFVYGTLKVGGYFAKQFDYTRKSSKVATLHNHDLFVVGNVPSQFPGAVPGKGSIIGEIHEFALNQVMPITTCMDMIEGYSKKCEYESLYLRRILSVELEDGSLVDANVYLFNRPIKKQYKKIESGIWEI